MSTLVVSQSMILEAEGISVTRGEATLLDAVSLQLQAGELVGLIGPNGAGKSTLLQVLAGLLVPEEGVVTLQGELLSKFKPRERSRQLAWLEQNGQVNWPLSVERIVALGRLPHLAGWQKPGEKDAKAVELALRETDIFHLRERATTTLSGGERSRVLMARALAAKPTILLADEPIAALDLGHQLQTMELLRNFAQGEQACVVVLHDLSLAARFCDRLYLLDQGKLIVSGGASEVLSIGNLRKVYGVECAVGGEDVPWIIPLRTV